MPLDFAIREPLSVETLYAGHERQPVLIVDDFMRDPEALVSYAATQAEWGRSDSQYPGMIAWAPEAYCEALLNVLGPRIAEAYAVKIDTAHLTSLIFAIATVPPEKLYYRQRVPHLDGYGQGVIAGLHYLCASTQGGTGLFRHRATGYESLTAEQHEHMQRLVAAELASQGEFPAKYVGDDNPLFELTLRLEAKFNRLVIYRGSMLHSMLVDENTVLDTNPRVGRLTINTFLRFDSA